MVQGEICIIVTKELLEYSSCPIDEIDFYELIQSNMKDYDNIWRFAASNYCR